MNNQKAVKRTKSNGASLLVHSIFHTIQGEGPFTGVPAVFVRLGGCNLQCPGCDTEYTEGAGILTVQEIFDLIGLASGGTKTNLVVITGGEPFRQNLEILVNQLHNNKVRVQIETNGSMPPQGEFELQPVIVCSPKTSKLNPQMVDMIDAYKYVVDYTSVNRKDGLPLTALGHQATPQLARPPHDFLGTVYLQPMDMTEHYRGVTEDLANDGYLAEEHNQSNVACCVQECMTHGYTFQLQLHKLINVE